MLTDESPFPVFQRCADCRHAIKNFDDFKCRNLKAAHGSTYLLTKMMNGQDCFVDSLRKGPICPGFEQAPPKSDSKWNWWSFALGIYTGTFVLAALIHFFGR